MKAKILFVDDDPIVLRAYRRQLRDRFDVQTAVGPREGQAAVRQRGPFAVVVCDRRMPDMNGIEFLSWVREQSPETVRIMLTGYADLETTIQAVNEGNVFRFLCKPCPPVLLVRALEDAVEQYRLILAEKELLSGTLQGAVKVLTELLGLVNPEAFGRAARLRELAKRLAVHLGLEQTWQVETAAMLAQIGCVTVPQELLDKVYRGESLTAAEQEQFEQHPRVGAQLLRHIPRMEEVADAVELHLLRLDQAEHSGRKQPLAARILKVCFDYDILVEAQGHSPEQGLAELKSRRGWYDPKVLDALQAELAEHQQGAVLETSLSGLRDGMVLAADVKTVSGKLLVSKGQEVTESLRARLANFARNEPICEPIYVYAEQQELQELSC